MNIVFAHFGPEDSQDDSIDNEQPITNTETSVETGPEMTDSQPADLGGDNDDSAIDSSNAPDVMPR
jgi:hypothetical protein